MQLKAADLIEHVLPSATIIIEGLICRNKNTKNDTCKGDCSIASAGNLRQVSLF